MTQGEPKAIAVGLDGSDASSDALRWAVDLAAQTGAEVRAVGTWRMPLVAAFAPLMETAPTPEFMAERCAERLETSIAGAGLAPEDSATIERVVREGDPGTVLTEESSNADLVVVGRTGSGRRHGVARAAEVMLGSTARHVINHAAGPVAAVPRGDHPVDDLEVLVGVDGSPSSLAALAWAVDALPDATTINALRAVPSYLEGLLAIDRTIIERAVANTEAELRASIAWALGDLDEETVAAVRPWVVVESPKYALVEPGFDVDLIVVGERGTSGIARRLLGSVSDHVVRHADCPVVILPEPAGGR